jgi:hypothetical protein
MLPMWCLQPWSHIWHVWKRLMICFVAFPFHGKIK